MMSMIIIPLIFALSIPGSYSIKCQKCEASQGDCNSGVCEGTYCTAFIVVNKATGARTMRKDCAANNPAGTKEDGCVKDALPDGSENYRCGCNSDTCNSEAGIARMQAMLSNQFSLPGSGGAAGSSAAGTGLQASGQQPSGSLSQVPSGLINPNSSFTDVIAAQPTPFPGAAPNPNSNLNPNQQSASGQPLPGSSLSNGPLQPLSGSPNSGQLPSGSANGSQPPFPQGPANVPPGASNPNKPVGQRPTDQETETDFGGASGASGAAGIPPDTNMVGMHGTHNSNESNSFPSDSRPQPPTNDLGGNSVSGQAPQTRSGTASAKARTCACSEPACNGRPCTGEACYQMMFSASDVHSPAFSGKQGQVVYSGCTNEPNVITGGAHHSHSQRSDYKFKLNGQEITVPATASYCNDADFCNGVASVCAKSMAIIIGVVLAVALVKF